MPSISGYIRNPRVQKLSAAGISAAGAAAIALTVVPATAAHGEASQATAKTVSAEPVAFTAQNSTVSGQGKSFAQQSEATEQRVQDEAAAKKEAAAAQEKSDQQALQQRVADKRAERAAKESREDRKADRSEKREAPRSYPNNLDGWIREARSIMKKHDIPGSYDGIKRNIIRESAGDPNAINDWDINARNGIPSKGLLQVIQPTFDAYHVKGTPKKLTDPVANIVAACNYAADRYGSMDNVDSAY
ncbi:lytic transglycosylase [Streptomyces sp. AJS327]|uniref:transglycosylase SLT domain-containing protein n=1 Tax=Streptomyces sp. AJS327 TaxID=2545265 RepID=UPI0015E01D3E|nr:transglycosylase SLT domain-containing protein [Streptomyces sp. AJS327]MBA0050308.1 lytic transglycosylase [Streptomyces sp. AJS327]